MAEPTPIENARALILERGDRISTHYDGCERRHIDCAALRVLRELERLQLENAVLRDAANGMHWMARRYADGRSTYATSMFNQHTRALLQLGVMLNPAGEGTIWARDGMGRAYDGLSDEEAAMGEPVRYDWVAEEVERLRGEKEAVYVERNLVVALAARFALSLHRLVSPNYDAWRDRHVGEEGAAWDDDWRNVVFIRTPRGQVSWHVHERELPLLGFLPIGGETWDGHTTEEKHLRIRAFLEAQAEGGEAS